MKLTRTIAPRLDARRGQRGFTLVEFMVALTGGLFVSIAIFVLAKHSSRFYQRELRVGNATLSSMVGFERLRTDIARAGYMSSPNIQRDPTVCGNAALYPNYMSQLASVHISNIAGVPIAGVPLLPAVYAANLLKPQRITLVGNYTSVDQFPVRQIETLANGSYLVHLQAILGGGGGIELANLGYIGGVTPAEIATLQGLFRVDNVARIVDKRGATQFGRISAVGTGANPSVTLAPLPALNFMATSGPLNCGVHGHETGAYINPVDIIRYDLQTLKEDTRYAPVYAYDNEDVPPYELDRQELIREEVDANSTAYPPLAIPGTQELIAEYAMDLRFQVTVAPTDSDPLEVVDDTEVHLWAGRPSEHGANQGPQLIRNIRTWLSVRSREADRLDAVSDAPSGGPLLRVALGPGKTAPYARVRTVQSYIALRNQTGVTWQ